MRLPSFHTPRFKLIASGCPHRQTGSAVIIVLALLAILLVYMAGNIRTLSNLGRELRLLERQQIRRLQAAAPQTNAPPANAVSTNAAPGSLVR